MSASWVVQGTPSSCSIRTHLSIMAKKRLCSPALSYWSVGVIEVSFVSSSESIAICDVVCSRRSLEETITVLMLLLPSNNAQLGVKLLWIVRYGLRGKYSGEIRRRKHCQNVPQAVPFPLRGNTPSSHQSSDSEAFSVCQGLASLVFSRHQPFVSHGHCWSNVLAMKGSALQGSRSLEFAFSSSLAPLLMDMYIYICALML